MQNEFTSMKPSPVLPLWMTENRPHTLEEKLILLKQKKHLLKDTTEMGEFLRTLLAEVKEQQKSAEEEAAHLEPLAYFQPSYEQALILNCWIYGIAFICTYSANRVGKTTAKIINFLLWILPNEKSWLIFKSYIVGGEGDTHAPLNQSNPNKGKRVQVLRRPSMETFQLIQKIAKKKPINVQAPDPYKQFYDPHNQPFLHWMQKQLSHHLHTQPNQTLRSPYPAPPWNKDGKIWFGGPDHDHFKNIIMPLWRQYTPPRIIEADVESNKTFTFVIQQPGDGNALKKTTWEWIGKSFESKTEKWASGAVDAILVTEGLPPDKWTEIKARFKDPSIGSHDFTPDEPANVGAATAFAQRIKKGTEVVPIPYFVFTEFSVYAAPDQVMSKEKQQQLISAYEGKPEAASRLEGKFYSSSALVLSNLDRTIHLLNWSTTELFRRYPTAQLYRGIDPGIDHPTACAWGALLPTNQWVIYRIFCEPGLSISQRCKEIVTRSHNTLHKRKWGPRPEDFYLEEIHNTSQSEVITQTVCDYHTFKLDETTGQPYSLNYITQGLVISESVHMGPEDRALRLDDYLQPNPFVPDLRSNVPPGARVYFLKNEPGIMAAFLKWEELYWDRKRSGDDKGAPKDKVPSHGDDELDAVCYLTCSPFRWTSYRPSAKLPNESEPEQQMIQASQRIQEVRQSVTALGRGNGQEQQQLTLHPMQNQPVYFGHPHIPSSESEDDPYSYDRY
jgi:hypothetical protein